MYLNLRKISGGKHLCAVREGHEFWGWPHTLTPQSDMQTTHIIEQLAGELSDQENI